MRHLTRQARLSRHAPQPPHPNSSSLRIDMARCRSCGAKLGLLERIAGEVCTECEDGARSARDSARGRYGQIVDGLASGSTAPDVATAELRDITPKAVFKPGELAEIHGKALHTWVSRILADDVLTEAEERQFVEATEALGLSMADLSRLDQHVMVRLVIAQANAGRLAALEEGESRLMRKRDEVVHLETPAGLLKEVTKRGYSGGYAGFSFRIAKGVRFHTGGTRGQSIVLGTELQVEDSGTLVISSTRVVFMGQRKSLEMPFAKMLGLEVFTDGIRFNVSNRQRAPLFQVPSGELVAAIVNAAAQRVQSDAP
jgi:hypothetical protein